jgi:uncharacterized protein (DUF433 family)
VVAPSGAAVSFEIVPRARPPFRRSPDIHGGQPVFAGTTIPLQVLLDGLNRGEDMAGLLADHPGVTEAQVRAVLSWALEELIARERLPVGPPQASLLPRVKDGVITNTGELRADQVTGRKAVCPACGRLVFQSWPEGWDTHAEHRCAGVTAVDAEARKTEFKHRYGYLFRATGGRAEEQTGGEP